jgi:hypothetical protein
MAKTASLCLCGSLGLTVLWGGWGWTIDVGACECVVQLSRVAGASEVGGRGLRWEVGRVSR